MRFNELVARPELGIQVIVAAENASERMVSGAYITDLPDPSRFLTQDDLVLTSGLWSQRPGGSRQFLGALASQKVSAVVIGLIEIGQLPPEVIDLCRELGLTLATLAEKVSFKSVSDAIEQGQQGSPGAVAARQAELASSLADVLARGDGARAALRVFADRFAEQFAVSAWVIDDRGTPIAAVGCSPSRAHIAGVWNHALEGGTSRVTSVTTAGVTSSIWPLVASQNRPAGSLVFDGDYRELPAEVRGGFDTLVGALRVEFEFSLRWRDARRSRVSELVQLLVDDAVSPTELATRLRLEGLDPQLPTSVVVGEVHGHGFPAEAALEVMNRLFSSQTTQVIGCVLADQPVLLVNGEGATTAGEPSRFDAAVRALAETYLPLLAGRQLRVGLSDAMAGVSALGAGYAVARERLSGVTGDEAVLLGTASSIQSHRALLGMLGERTRTSFGALVLRPLVEYDAKHGAAFVETLRVFLNTGGAWQEAARSLHLHPNTLRYRIARIEELTGRDVSSMDDRVDLYLALACLST
ncbi:PucR family transcriptional regulator [Subtercola sp. RTI3]|uniref:PucR family transcriptional regulator n=1 Tax=Subtercola sp. RTI3 TaxID=3048639 RepID=UPI002B223FBE|nr:helix-turn-helix domain-containing protein [Subtercola sp. RTI3]MEA9985151.1 helix-turn-helix domain-containing protein [Subtercola sp. RTI3]